MKFKAINTLSIKELFISQIEEMILSGELKPGDKLPTERELADEMNISKTIVHDGIRELARIGFLQEDMKKALDADIESFANTLFLYRRTIASLSGNCISPMVMNAFFTAVRLFRDQIEQYRALLYARIGFSPSANRSFFA